MSMTLVLKTRGPTQSYAHDKDCIRVYLPMMLEIKTEVIRNECPNHSAPNEDPRKMT